MARKNSPQTHSRYWPIEVMAGLVFVIVVVLIGIFSSLRQPNTPPTSQAKYLISTPLSYQDFIGQVKAVDQDTLAVQFIGTGSDGRNFTKLYAVSVDDQTEIKAVSSTNNQVQFAPLQLTDIHPDDAVFVAGDEDLASLKSFTATRLYRYQPAT